MKASANKELAEEINIIPTSLLHSYSGGQGQGRLQVQATPGTSLLAALSRPFPPIPHLSTASAPRPRFPTPGKAGIHPAPGTNLFFSISLCVDLKKKEKTMNSSV